MKHILAAILGIISFVECIAQVIAMQPNIREGGRAVAIARHPANNNQFIVASETGGLFKSTNGGANWSQVSGSTTFWFTHVLYYPPNGNIVLATAEKDSKVMSGGGIWRSTDGGNSWTRVVLTPAVNGCNNIIAAYALSFDATVNRLWAGTSCGLAFSDDGGASWMFLPSSANFNNDKVYAILSPGNRVLQILTDAGVKVSADRGASWTVSNTGLPSFIQRQSHNQIACSPLNNQHLFWAFNYWRDRWRRALYMSADNGSSWTVILDDTISNRPPFVKAVNARNGNSSQFDLYYGDGGCSFKRATFNNAATPTIAGAWTSMAHDHCDGSDVAFGTDGRTPLLFISDGGVHATADAGANWTFVGGGSKGYNALQITEVTGQKHGTNNTSDLYFSTQDNHTWASPDEGITWPGVRCCEGFFLNIHRQPLPAADTRFTFVSCGGCANLVSGPVLSNVTDFRNPPNENGNPRLLEPRKYVHNTKVSGLPASIFNFTSDNGATWVPRYGFPEEPKDLSKTSGSGAPTNIFVAVRVPGATPDLNEMIGIKRITGVLDEGTPIVSNITGFGSLGTFSTMFAQYRPFGVDAHDANHLIVPDIVNNIVKVSYDGGATWRPDSALTRFVTQNGVFKFKWADRSQISNISFDPDRAGHILVGTVQAGIFRSCDNGDSWSKVQNSELIPNVSSFYFLGNYKAIASSYGRGLWRLQLSACRLTTRRPVTDYQVDKPFIFYRDALLPINDIGDITACTKCAFYFVKQGEIRAYSTQGNKVTSVVISAGNISGTKTPPFRVATNPRLASAFARDKKLIPLFQNKYQVKGIYLEGNIFKGLILAKKDLTAADLPKQNIQPNLHGELLYAGRNVKGIRLYGSGFQKDAPLEVLIDGQPVQLNQKEQYDDKGILTLTIIHPFTVGSHTILLIQRTSKGTLREAYTFNVSTHD